jgi:hypothetical protein
LHRELPGRDAVINNAAGAGEALGEIGVRRTARADEVQLAGNDGVNGGRIELGGVRVAVGIGVDELNLGDAACVIG